MSKNLRERNVEALTMGSVLLLFLLTLCGPVSGWLFSLLAAVILLGSASYQKSQGWKVSRWTWLFGGIFAAFCALQIIGIALKLTLGLLWNIALPLLVLGLVVWFIFFKGKE